MAAAKQVSSRNWLCCGPPAPPDFASQPHQHNKPNVRTKLAPKLSGGWVWLGSGPTRSGVTVLIVPSILDLRVIRLNPTLHAPTGWNTYLPVLLVQTRSTNKKPVFDLLLLVLTPTYNFCLRHQELSLKLEHVSYSTIGNVPRVT